MKQEIWSAGNLVEGVNYRFGKYLALCLDSGNIDRSPLSYILWKENAHARLWRACDFPHVFNRKISIDWIAKFLISYSENDSFQSVDNFFDSYEIFGTATSKCLVANSLSIFAWKNNISNYDKL